MLQRLLDTLTKDLLLKLTALGLAFLLWTLVKTDNQVGIDEIPVQVMNRDAGWVLASEPEPPVVRVVFSGPVRELIRAAAERPSILVPLDNVTDSTEVVVLRPGWVALGKGLDNTRVDEIRPAAVRLSFDRVTSRLIPVAVTVLGAPPAGFELVGHVLLEPAAVRATGPTRALERMDSLRLPALDLTRHTVSDTIVVPLDSLDRRNRAVVLSPQEVRMIVSIRATADTTGSRGGRRGRSPE